MVSSVLTPHKAKKQYIASVRKLAIDTETTGLFLRFGCTPFIVTASDGETTYLWVGDVDPFTREVTFDPSDIQEMKETFDNYDIYIMHNCMFDIPALGRLGIEIDISKVQDSMWKSHVWQSCGPHGLKERCRYIFETSDADESGMDKAVQESRSIARSIRNQIRKLYPDADPVKPPFLQLAYSKKSGVPKEKQIQFKHPHFPRLLGSKESAKSDLWLPKAIFKLSNDIEYREMLFDQHSISKDCQTAIVSYLRKRQQKISPRWEHLTEDYACLDAERTIALDETLQDAINKSGTGGGCKLLHDLTEPLLDIHNWGISFSEERAQSEIERLEKIKEDMHVRANKAIEHHWDGTVNFNSGPQMQKLMFGWISKKEAEDRQVDDQLCLKDEFFNFGFKPIKFTDSDAPSTDADTILDCYRIAYDKGIKQWKPAKEFLTGLLMWRKADKAISYLTSYLDYLIGGRIHSSVKPTGTDTTRNSSSDPNQQNVGKANPPFPNEPCFEELTELMRELDIYLRRSFGPPTKEQLIKVSDPPQMQDFDRGDGVWLEYPTAEQMDWEGSIVDREWYPCDYGQLQLRIWAFVCPEPELIKAFSEGWNAHEFTASRIFDWDKYGKPEHPGEQAAQKRIGKNVNFGFIFGAGVKKIEQTAKRPGLWQVVQQVFPSAVRLKNEVERVVRKLGYIDLGNYLPKIPDDYIYDVDYSQFNLRYDTSGKPNLPFYRLYCDQPHKGVNYIVQGIEGLIVKRAWRLCTEYLKEQYPHRHIPKVSDVLYPFVPTRNDAGISMQVHDEFVFDLPVNETRTPITNGNLSGYRVTNENKPIVQALQMCMEQAGEDFGISTPVNTGRVKTNTGWNNEIAV